MNGKRRRTLEKVVSALSDAKQTIEQVLDEERDSLDNTPEGLQNSEQYRWKEDVVDLMEDACCSIEEATQSITDAIS